MNEGKSESSSGSSSSSSASKAKESANATKTQGTSTTTTAVAPKPVIKRTLPSVPKQLVPLSTEGHQEMPSWWNHGQNQGLKTGGPPESTVAAQALHAAASVAAAVIAGRPSAVAIDAHEQATAARADAEAAKRSASQARSTADSVVDRVDELRSRLAKAARLRAEALRRLETRMSGV